MSAAMDVDVDVTKKVDSNVKLMLLKRREDSSKARKKTLDRITVKTEIKGNEAMPSLFVFDVRQHGYHTNVTEVKTIIKKNGKNVEIQKYLEGGFSFTTHDIEETKNEEWVFADNVVNEYVPILDLSEEERKLEIKAFVEDLLRVNSPPEVVATSTEYLRKGWFSENEFTLGEEFVQVVYNEERRTDDKGKPSMISIKYFVKSEDEHNFTINEKGEKKKMVHFKLRDDFKVGGVSFKDAEAYALAPLDEKSIMDTYWWNPKVVYNDEGKDLAEAKGGADEDGNEEKDDDMDLGNGLKVFHDWSSLSGEEKAKMYAHIKESNEKLQQKRLSFNYVEYLDMQLRNRYEWAVARIAVIEASLPEEMIISEEEEKKKQKTVKKDEKKLTPDEVKNKEMRNDITAYKAIIAQVKEDRSGFHKDVYDEDVTTRRIFRSIIKELKRASKGGEKIAPFCQMDVAKIKRTFHEVNKQKKAELDKVSQFLLQQEIKANEAYALKKEEERIRKREEKMKNSKVLTEKEAYELMMANKMIMTDGTTRSTAEKKPEEEEKPRPKRKVAPVFLGVIPGTGTTEIQSKLAPVAEDPDVVTL